ncbi:MAG: YtxH domain-containing protein, partial [Chryseobacterium sp.]
VYAGFKYVTKKDPITGKSIIDDIKDQAPEWIDKAKGYKNDFAQRAEYAKDDLGI